MNTMLTGSELLTTFDERVKAGATEVEAIKACGYGSPKNEKRVDSKGFYRALVEAKGVQLPERKQGRTTAWCIKVQKNGTLALGAAYTRKMGLKPGTPCNIEVQDGVASLRAQKEDVLA